jgi:hypothetical protein
MGISDAVQEIELWAAEDSRYGEELDLGSAQGVGLGQPGLDDSSPAVRRERDE